VDIIGGQISFGPLSNPIHFNYIIRDISFYTSTVESERNIQFVIDAINKDDLNRVFEKKKDFIQSLNGNLIIRDSKGFFAIERVSEDQESYYKIDKISGKIYDVLHNQLVVLPRIENEEDKLAEIKK
jgi:hypothetical protein